MIPWRGMQPSTARDSGQVDLRRSTTDIPPPQSAALGLHPVARRLLLINRPRRDATLSRRWYTAATGGSRTRDLEIAKSSLAPLGHRVPIQVGQCLNFKERKRRRRYLFDSNTCTRLWCINLHSGSAYSYDQSMSINPDKIVKKQFVSAASLCTGHISMSTG